MLRYCQHLKRQRRRQAADHEHMRALDKSEFMQVAGPDDIHPRVLEDQGGRQLGATCKAGSIWMFTGCWVLAHPNMPA